MFKTDHKSLLKYAKHMSSVDVSPFCLKNCPALFKPNSCGRHSRDKTGWYSVKTNLLKMIWFLGYTKVTRDIPVGIFTHVCQCREC